MPIFLLISLVAGTGSGTTGSTTTGGGSTLVGTMIGGCGGWAVLTGVSLNHEPKNLYKTISIITKPTTIATFRLTGLAKVSLRVLALARSRPIGSALANSSSSVTGEIESKSAN